MWVLLSPFIFVVIDSAVENHFVGGTLMAWHQTLPLHVDMSAAYITCWLKQTWIAGTQVMELHQRFLHVPLSYGQGVFKNHKGDHICLPNFCSFVYLWLIFLCNGIKLIIKTEEMLYVPGKKAKIKTAQMTSWYCKMHIECFNIFPFYLIIFWLVDYFGWTYLWWMLMRRTTKHMYDLRSAR